MRTIARNFFIVSLLAGASAFGQTVTVSSFSPSGWYNSYGDSGGGSSTLSNYAGIDGDGALRIQGDRTRAGFGNVFPASTNNSLGLLADLSGYSFQFAVAGVGATVPTAQAPALRLVVWDPSQGTSGRRISLVWEDGEQSTPQFVGNPSPVGSFDTTYNGDFFSPGSRVYAFTAGLGRGLFNPGGTMIAGSDSAVSFTSLAAQFGSGAAVTGLELGVGSSVSAFDGYADRVSIAFGDTPTTYNFVPTPGAAAALGLTALFGLRRRRSH